MSAVYLESFDGPEQTERVLSADYKRGFADATEAAEASHAARIAEAAQEVSTTLKDMTFGFEEARHFMEGRMAPVLGQVAELIVPDILQATFRLHLIQTLDHVVKTDVARPVLVAVHPDVVTLLQDAGPEMPPQVQLVADASLKAGQAVIADDGEATLLDLASLSEALTAALTAIETNERRKIHG